MSKLKEQKAIKKANPNEFEQALNELSTDDDKNSSKEHSFKKHKEQELLIVDKQLFNGDEWGNCTVSQTIEEKRFEELKKIFNLVNVGNGAALKKIAFSMCNEDYKAEQHIDHKVAVNIFGEIIDQLDIMGESTADIIDFYNLA